MHENVVLGGPIWWFAATLMVLAGLLGLFVFFDSLFVRREPFVRLPEPRWSYTVGQAIYLFILGAAQGSGTPPLWSGVAVLLAPPALVQSLAYLLRAVYPRPASHKPAAEKSGRADDTISSRESGLRP